MRNRSQKNCNKIFSWLFAKCFFRKKPITWYTLLRVSNWIRFRWAFCHSRPIIMSRLPCLPWCSTYLRTLNSRVVYELWWFVSGLKIKINETLSGSLSFLFYCTHKGEIVQSKYDYDYKSKISEKLGRCGKKNMLRPYLEIWDWNWILGCAVKAIFSLGVLSPWLIQYKMYLVKTKCYTLYACQYNSQLVYFLHHFWSPLLCFQGGFFQKFCPYVWLVLKSGF